MSPDEITVMLRDSGFAFDPATIKAEPQTGSFPRRGFGLYLIRLIVDELQYERTEDGYKVLILVKRF